MSVRGNLRKFAVIATVAAAAAVVTPTVAVAHGGGHQPSAQSGLQAGNAAVGLVGPRANWLQWFDRSNG
ncbi:MULTISPECIES: hypothetical protein [unclassified Streptomyces]|uniref:hypothetical protein n=1 Tax=Streptomycetaceae TaxID=2062 RepID=UPI002E77A931|nr:MULTISPECIES: hypothetical protein [unclassified Streptomyces]MED7947735.1 hypothetical protein [Streptomyces sp. BE303]MEE1822604.1 hypothetical protein [Streptomyces sp. BE20]